MALGIMCFGKKSSNDGESKRNNMIEKQLKEDRKRAEREVKILLLGNLILVLC
jgi:guanine nucleotide-binding protein subunit alpha